MKRIDVVDEIIRETISNMQYAEMLKYVYEKEEELLDTYEDQQLEIEYLHVCGKHITIEE